MSIVAHPFVLYIISWYRKSGRKRETQLQRRNTEKRGWISELEVADYSFLVHIKGTNLLFNLSANLLYNICWMINHHSCDFYHCIANQLTSCWLFSCLLFTQLTYDPLLVLRKLLVWGERMVNDRQKLLWLSSLATLWRHLYVPVGWPHRPTRLIL